MQRLPFPARPRASVRKPKARLTLEALEDRAVPATWSVTTLTDTSDRSAGLSLRAAITQANASPEADTIQFAVAGTINLGGALPDLAGQLTIDAGTGGSVTVRRYSGGVYGVFFVQAGADVRLFG